MTVRTKFIFFLLKAFNIKKLAYKSFTKPKRSKTFKYPGKLRKLFNTSRFLVNNRAVVTFEAKANTKHKHILFLHGGGYTVEVQPGHWWLIEALIRKTLCRISIIDYPLAPENNCTESHQCVHQAYTELIKRHPEDDFYLLGDSAGGGFCLSVAQTLRNNNYAKIPEKIILLFPWLDVSMSNPGIKMLEEKELLLDIDALSFCANSFSGGLELTNPLLSPLYDHMNDLNHIALFVGTHEIFLPDCRIAKDKIEKSNTSLYYKEYINMQHDWLLYPVHERQQLLQDVSDFILK